MSSEIGANGVNAAEGNATQPDLRIFFRYNERLFPPHPTEEEFYNGMRRNIAELVERPPQNPRWPIDYLEKDWMGFSGAEALPSYVAAGFIGHQEARDVYHNFLQKYVDRAEARIGTLEGADRDEEEERTDARRSKIAALDKGEMVEVGRDIAVRYI